MTNAQKMIRAKIEQCGSVFLRLSKDTPWTMNTLKSLARSGYGIREVYTVYSGREFEVYKLR